MDFLDPRKKSVRRSKLIISYLLMALLIVAAAVVLLGSSFGYGYNRQTGQIVQNGLVFIDSAPAKAKIFLDGKDTNRSTSAHALFPGAVRMVLPTGSYEVNLQADGYRPWGTEFNLSSQMILRLDYALLLPLKLTSVVADTYKTPPAFLSQTPDQKWILAAFTDSKGGLNFRQYNASSQSLSPASLSLPATVPGFNGNAWLPLAWSSDSNSMLLVHSQASKTEYIVFNRDKPAESLNINTASKLTPNKVMMRDGKTDLLYLLQGGKLYSFAPGGNSSSLLASGVLDFTPHQSGQILYMASSTSGPLAQLKDGAQVYTLAKLKNATRYFLAAVNYQDHNYLAVGSDAESVRIFKDPLPTLKSSPASLKALAVLKLSATQQLKPSIGSHFLTAQSSNVFAAYDFATQTNFSYRLKQPLANEAVWLDEYHLGSRTAAGAAMVWDYNGANQQQLGSSLMPQGAYFGPGYKTMFTLSANSSGSRTLTTTDLQL